MFDKTVTVKSTDQALELDITAGTEGVKSSALRVSGRVVSVPVQQLVDLAQAAWTEFAEKQPD